MGMILEDAIAIEAEKTTTGKHIFRAVCPNLN
jgi:hypothetical protein